MTEIYTIEYLKKHTVNLSKEDTFNIPRDIIKKLNVRKDHKATQFIANYDNSKIFFSVPQEMILVLGRLFKKKNQLELGYLLDENIWYVLQKGTLLWSSEILRLEEKKRAPNFNRYEALKRNLNNNS